MVPEKVWEYTPVPELMVRFWFAPTVTVPLDVSPDVAVMRPEIVGVAVHDVPVTVRFPPRVVSPDPKRVRVGLVVVLPRAIFSAALVVSILR